MIQRIQTVYLLLTTLLAVLFLTGSVIGFNAGLDRLALGFSGIVSMPESGDNQIIKTLPVLSALMVALPVFSFIIIFLYKNRKLQMGLTIILIILILVEAAVVAVYSMQVIDSRNAEPVYTWRMVLPLLMLIFSVLAYSGIKKDENIVRSYDRLR